MDFFCMDSLVGARWLEKQLAVKGQDYKKVQG